MKIYLYSEDIQLVSRWQKLLKEHETCIVEEEQTLLEIENSILILCASSRFQNINYTIKTIHKNANKIAVLSRNPHFDEAKKWLEKEVNAYGNSLMSFSFLNSIIEALSKNYIWLPPNISTQFLKNMTKSTQNTNDEVLLKALSKAEKKVAVLLKEGLTNQNISDELNISINTVKTHIKHIYEKLNIKDRLCFLKLFKN